MDDGGYEPEACISYRQALPVAVVLAMGLGSASPAMAQAEGLDLDDGVELTTVTVGGAARIVPALFKESALAEPDHAGAPEAADHQPATTLSQRGDQ